MLSSYSTFAFEDPQGALFKLTEVPCSRMSYTILDILSKRIIAYHLHFYVQLLHFGLKPSYMTIITSLTTNDPDASG